MVKNKCFVCDTSHPSEKMEINKELLLHVCHNCKGTKAENKKIADYLDSLAEGFTCGCI